MVFLLFLPFQGLEMRVNGISVGFTLSGIENACE